MGKLPQWFDLWRYTALKNSDVNFVLIQDQMTDMVDCNIQYIQKPLSSINQLPLMKKNNFHCSSPYKLCDYRPLYAELFPEIVSGYAYWGWGDLDVIYGDINNTLGSSIGRFEYISTGWKGESGPLAVLKNCHKVNSLWRKIPEVEGLLRSKESFGLDEKHFLDILRVEVRSDIQFRECLKDLPAIWRDGRLKGKFSRKEYTLHHFGGHVSFSQEEISANSNMLLDWAKQGGGLEIRSDFRIVRENGVPNLFLKIAHYFQKFYKFWSALWFRAKSL